MAGAAPVRLLELLVIPTAGAVVEAEASTTLGSRWISSSALRMCATSSYDSSCDRMRLQAMKPKSS
ncbi:hypothetical protein FQZ97_1125900 [compost metagenome]